MKLVLHIGLHKTGTTFLQRQLQFQADDLSRQGWLFPRTGFTEHDAVAAKAFATPGHQGIAKAALHGDSKIRTALYNEISKAECPVVLISCENFSSPLMPPGRRAQNLNKVAKFFSGFDEIEVVAVIRRPDTYLESLYRERVVSLETAETRSAVHFVETTNFRALNFKEMLVPWRELADGNLTVLSYEKLRQNSDYLTAFGDALGFGLKSSNKLSASIYSSPSRQTVEVIRMANALSAPTEGRREILEAFLQSADHYEAEGRGLSAIPTALKIRLIDYAQQSSGNFFDSCNAKLDFDAMREAIEAERSNWQPLTNIDARLLDSYVFFSKSMPKAKKPTTVSRLLRGVTSRAELRGALQRIFDLLPPFGQKWMKAIYSRLR